MSNPFAFKATYDSENSYLTLQYARQKDIDNFIFPNNNIDYLDIFGDYLDTLIIPDGVEHACIDTLGLKHVYVPDSIKKLYCQDNFLETLDVPCTIENLVANNNILQTLTFRGGPPNNLFMLELEGNRFQRFDFEIPKCCEVLNINKNYNVKYISPSIREFIDTSDEMYIP